MVVSVEGFVLTGFVLERYGRRDDVSKRLRLSSAIFFFSTTKMARSCAAAFFSSAAVMARICFFLLLRSFDCT